MTSVFKNADPSNWGRSLLECNKDHLLSQARSEIVKQEHHVDSLNNCISELQEQTHAQRLELQDAQHGFVESRWEQVRLQEEYRWRKKVLRDTQIRSMHEMGDMKRAQELRVDDFSVQQLREKSWDNTTALFTIAGDARTDEFYEWFREISRNGIESQREIVSHFQSTCNDSKRQKNCRLIHGINRITGKRFW